MKKPNLYKLDLQLFAEGDSQDKDKIDPEKNYAKALEDLKKNTVSLEDYKKLEAQNKQLLDSIINGNRDNDGKDQKTVKPSINELREDLYGGNKQLTNLEYWDKTLKLRKELLELGETDPFVPNGRKIQATSEDYLRADRVATVMQECVDAANGDSEAFNAELRRRGIK